MMQRRGRMFGTARASLALASSLAVAVVSLPANAQQLPAAEAPTLAPPKLKFDPGVTYPEQALREGFDQNVAVTLVLEVGPDGHVRQSRVTEPRGHGFDEAARAAAKKLVFAPATRDGRPIAARITFRYDFTAPPTRLVGRVATLASDRPVSGARVTVRDASGREHVTTTARDGTWSLGGLPPGPIEVEVTRSGDLPARAEETLARGQETNIVLRLSPEPIAAPAEVGATQAPLEVVVTGERAPREVTKRTLGRDMIMHSAGTQGDALLSLQNLPGVARPPPFSGALIVRGSAPEETQIFIDGTNVPLAYHFGGLSSVVPTELLEKIDFYPGNYSARYGRGLGGVVDVGLRAPKRDGYHLMAENSILGLRGLAEGPLGRGWSFFLSGQRSWLDLLLTPVLKASGEAETALPRWADYQAAIQKDFGKDSSFRVLFFGSDDAFEIVNPIADSTDPTLGGDLRFHTRFWRLQGRWQSKLSEDTRLSFTTSFGRDLVTGSTGNTLVDYALNPLSGRAELSQRIAPGVLANLGFDLFYEPYSGVLQLPSPTRAGVPPGGLGQPPIRTSASEELFMPGFYTEFELVPWRGARIVPGLRADYDDAIRDWDVSPRVNLRQELTDGYPRTTLKGGVGRFFQPPDPMETSPRYGQAGLVSSGVLQSDVGFEQEFTRNLDLSLDVFYKHLDHLVVPTAKNSGSGVAYGVEWLLRYKPDEHFFGWVSYTLSRSERRELPTEPLRIFEFDQTHVLTVLGNYKLGRGWQLGARFRLGTGDLYTTRYPGAYNATVGSQLGVATSPPFDARLPMFHQLDVRIEKTSIKRHYRLTWYVDVQNVYLAKNPLGVTYNYNYTQAARVQGLPILPIAGLRLDLP
jgi:TonB family protein